MKAGTSARAQIAGVNFRKTVLERDHVTEEARTAKRRNDRLGCALIVDLRGYQGGRVDHADRLAAPPSARHL